jgi:hypothetical protein
MALMDDGSNIDEDDCEKIGEEMEEDEAEG